MKPAQLPLQGWHGFDWSEAVVTDQWDRRRLIEVLSGFSLNDLNGAVYLIERDGSSAPLPACDAGRATFCATGDTLVFRHRSRDGYEHIYDCVVRTVYHPRCEGCGPDFEP